MQPPIDHRWKIWKKYQNLFPSKRYLLINRPLVGKFKTSRIILIDIAAFSSAINSNKKLFSEKLGSESNAEDILAKISSGESLEEALENHEDLLGIVLGYGQHNSKLFERRMELDFVGISPPFTYSEEELESLKTRLQGFTPRGNNLFRIGSVAFVADLEHPVTRQLNKKYSAARQRLNQLFANKSFLHTFLELYVSPTYLNTSEGATSHKVEVGRRLWMD